MKHKKRLAVLEQKNNSKKLKIRLLKYSMRAEEREDEISKQKADIIVWFYNDAPKKWIDR